MKEYVPFIGDSVYFYSTSLDEVVEGIVEGYADDSNRRYKILQEFAIEGNAVLRHVVSYIYVFETYDEALACKEEFRVNESRELFLGNVVYIIDSNRTPIFDKHHRPCKYQVVSIYKDKEKVGLVTSYGEYIGLYDFKDVLYVEEGPLFKKDDYELGTSVVWAEGEDVYEGVIETLHETSARVGNIKKLLPINKTIRVPYWKIPEGRKTMEDSTPNVIHTIIGDDLD